MEGYKLNICSRENGFLFQNKTFVPVNGPVFTISNTSPEKSVSFIHATWNTVGTQIVASDNLGYVYLFYLKKNRFIVLSHLKSCCTFLIFTNDKTQDILAALADCSIVSINSGSKSVKNEFNQHTSNVVHISINKINDTVLSCSKEQAILWNLKTFDVVRVLTLKKDVDIVKVLFLPVSDIIVSAFNDNSVFLWNFKNFKCLSQFICSSKDNYLNIKTVAASRDENLLACAGKANWFIVWNISENKRLVTVALTDNSSTIKQIYFLPNVRDKYHVIVLTANGEIQVFDLKCMVLVHQFQSNSGKVISFAVAKNEFQVITITKQGNMELYVLDDFLQVSEVSLKQKEIGKTFPAVEEKKQLQKKKTKMKKLKFDVDKTKLKFVIRNFEEYPEKHRFFVWSKLLELPHNVEAFKVLHQESLRITPFIKDYTFINPGVQKTFIRLMSMLACWHPVIKEIDYFQCVYFPFIKVLHKNPIMCFEFLVTLTSNWCQNWFLFCPFCPFNILCAVENILAYHDAELLAHFMKQDIPVEVYAWSLLKSSFSEVFSKKEWLKLWDNIFSNPLPFQLYVAAAFNIAMRDILLACKTVDQFKKCYRRHGIPASLLLKTAYRLQQDSPNNVDPGLVVGTFSAIPRDVYPNFFEMSQMKLDLQTLERKRLIDQEIDYLKQREDYLDIKTNYLRELQDLQILRRKLLLESIELKNTEALESLDRKLRNVQSLIQENLTNQVGMLKGTLGEDMFGGSDSDVKRSHFKFQDYVKKLTKR